MEITFIGAILFVVASGLFVAGSTLALFVLLMLCSLMGGSAALILTGLGGSSILPVQFVMPFLAARILLGGREQLPRLAQAIRALAPLLVYTGYGIAAAIAAPRIFARQMTVPPLRLRASSYLFEAVPLVPSSQNLTTSIYLCGTLIVAVCAFVACQRAGGAAAFVRTAVVLAWVHVFLGVSDIAFGGTAYGEVLGLFRNATYAQLDQSYGNFIRIKGIFPEASGYAAFAFTWFVFLFECWFRHVRPRSTGPAALAIGLVLVFSTSGTAYVGLAGYLGLIVLRSLIAPQGVTGDRLLALGAAVLAGAVAVSLAVILLPGFAGDFGGMITHMTVDKGDSSSGLQRMFWARKGIEAFQVSHGLGIGPGSFRSSSLLTAILGSSGVIGIAAFAAHVLNTFKPLRATTYAGSADARIATGVAAAWAMLVSLIPASVSAPSVDPGFAFAIFSGCALALRGGSAAPAPHPADAAARAPHPAFGRS